MKNFNFSYQDEYDEVWDKNAKRTSHNWCQSSNCQKGAVLEDFAFLSSQVKL